MTRLDALRALEQKVAAGELPMWTEITGAIGLNPDNRHISFYAAYHGSLDAAKALRKAVLPGSWVIISADAKGCTVIIGVDAVKELARADDRDEARAELLSIIRALIAEAEA